MAFAEARRSSAPDGLGNRVRSLFATAGEVYLPTAPTRLTAVAELPRQLPEVTIEGGMVNHKALSVFGREVDAYHVTPTNEQSRGRILLANGWRGNISSQKEYITHLVKAGYTVSTFNNDFTRGDEETMSHADQALKTINKVPKIELIKAAAVTETLKAFQPDYPGQKVGIVAHSEGTIYSGMVAALDPEIDFFLEINSAGRTKVLSRAGIIMRSGIESVNTKLHSSEDREAASVGDALNYFKRNFRTAVSEIGAIGTITTARMIDFRHSQGLKTGIISGIRDRLFHPRHLKKQIEAGSFDYVGEVNGLHELSSNPEGYANETLRAIAHYEDHTQPNLALVA